jgi:hypothetical protein
LQICKKSWGFNDAPRFFITSLTLAYLATPASTEKKSESVMDQVVIDLVPSDVPTVDAKTKLPTPYE